MAYWNYFIEESLDIKHINHKSRKEKEMLGDYVGKILFVDLSIGEIKKSHRGEDVL
jgi:hypothetical protein